MLDSNCTWKIIAMTKMTGLAQKGSATAYTSEFLSLANAIGLEGPRKLMEFHKALSEPLRKGLAITGCHLFGPKLVNLLSPSYCQHTRTHPPQGHSLATGSKNQSCRTHQIARRTWTYLNFLDPIIRKT